MKPVTQAMTGNKNNSTSVARPSLKKKSHSQLILGYLEAGNRLTFLESLRLFKCRALAQRISELRSQGHLIRSRMVETPGAAKISEYWIEQPNSEGS